MTSRSAETFVLSIMMAGDISAAKMICRKYCMETGFCVSIEPVSYIYTGGEEEGFRVGIMNYPRFPATNARLWECATALACLLREGLYQHSYSIIGPDMTVWHTERQEPPHV